VLAHGECVMVLATNIAHWLVGKVGSLARLAPWQGWLLVARYLFLVTAKARSASKHSVITGFYFFLH
jgi:hypothetical protein